MESGKVFENVKLFIADVASCIGRISLFSHVLGKGVLFVENGSKPIDQSEFSKFLFSPVASPMLTVGGHYFFDLNYFSEITTMEGPPRCCLHDILHKPSICLNFQSKEIINEFVAFLTHEITFYVATLPGFYTICRVYPSLCNTVVFATVKDQLKLSLIKSSSANELLLFEAQNALAPFITPKTLQTEGTDENVEDALKSRATLIDYLEKHLMPGSHKGIAWNLLISLPSFEEINPVIMERYMETKEQIATLTESQLCRCKTLRNFINSMEEEVRLAKTELNDICNCEKIIEVAFNVLMSIGIMYDSLFQFCPELMRLAIIVIDMYVRAYDGEMFEVCGGTKIDANTLEASIFWSLIYLLEKCELRKILCQSDASIAADFSDFLFLIHPQLFKLLHEKKLSNFECFAPNLKMMCATILKSGPCQDIWLSACSVDSPFDFMISMMAFVTFLIFPNVTSSTTSTQFEHLIRDVFNSPGVSYLISTAYLVLKNTKKIVHRNFPTLFK